MSEIIYNLPPYKVEDVCSSLSQAKSQQVGWQIRAWQAHKIHEEFGVSGVGVRVGVGDTGVSAEHMIGELSGVFDAESFVGDNNYRDRNGHGSHCLGIIGAKNNDGGMVGYAPDCQMWSAKVLSDRGSGGDAGIAAGIRKMTKAGCHIISLSLGSPQRSSVITKAIQEAESQGVIVFAAAGNDGRSNDIDYPAAGGHCVPVGAVNHELKLASFSDRGPLLKSHGMVGGGVNVYSTVVRGYASYSGTSMATPGLAGQCALLLSAELKYTGRIRTDSRAKFIEVMKKHRLDLGPVGDDEAYGLGAFDVYSAVKAVVEEAKQPEQPEPPKPEEPNPPVEDRWRTVLQNSEMRIQVLNR